MRTGNRLDRPQNAKVVVKSWPIPQAFTAAAGALWLVTPNTQTLQAQPGEPEDPHQLRRRGRDRRHRRALSATYGASFLWLSQATPNDLGQINKISPSSRLVKGAVSTGLDIGLTCTAAGAGAIGRPRWRTRRAASPRCWSKLSQTDLSEVARGTLPPGANPGAVKCLVAGGGLVWVTDGVGSVTTIQP